MREPQQGITGPLKPQREMIAISSMIKAIRLKMGGNSMPILALWSTKSCPRQYLLRPRHLLPHLLPFFIFSATPVPTTGGQTTITGSGFGATPTVTIAGASCAVTSSSSTSIVCTVPPGFGTNQAITITTNGQTVTQNIFDYTQNCTIGNNVPFINISQTAFSADSLFVTIQIQVTNSLLSTVYYIGNSTAPQCSFPSQYSTFIEQNGCVNSYLLQLPWGLHSACNFAKSSTAGYTTYTAPIYVTTVTEIGNLRGHLENETTTNILNIAVQFPSSVTVSTSVTVFSPVALESEVIEQAYYADSVSGVVAFDTSLQWPYVLEFGNVTSAPSGIIASAITEITANGACPGTNGSSCLQTFSFTLAPNGSCTLTGTYIASFIVTCRGPSAQCPLAGTVTSASVSFALSSTNFCAVVTNIVGVSSTLTAYSNSAEVLVKTAWVQDTSAFFVVAVTSSAPLSLTALQSVSVLSGANTLATYTITGAQGAGLVSNVTNNAASTSFVLFFSSSLFTVPVDGSATFSIQATAGLTYSQNSKRGITNIKSTLVHATHVARAISSGDSSTAQLDVQLTAAATGSQGTGTASGAGSIQANSIVASLLVLSSLALFAL